MLGFIELTLANIGVAIGVVIAVATLAGVAYYTFRSQKPKVRADAIKEFSEAFDGLEKKYELLEAKLKDVESEHQRCERRINRISAFNLRLQAREVKYQRTINWMERRMGQEVTDFSDITDSPEDPDFR